LYSSTKDHLNEFATLRAIGSSSNYIYTVIIWQAVLSAIIGFGGAAAVSSVVVSMTADSALPVTTTPALMAGLFLLTLMMCVGSAMAAIVQVMRIDPTLVFTR
jgi:putative ABC transport system permease protein